LFGIGSPRARHVVIFTETLIPGTFLVQPERHADDRGFFARTFCRREFEAQGLNADLVQCSISFNPRRGTLRGMHYQAAPDEEVRLVRCTRGAIYDVVLDLRPSSPAYKRHVGVELTADNTTLIYIPEGCAHGFQTLEDDTEVCYQMSRFYVAARSVGVRWDDPAFAIPWPPADRIISARDRAFPDFHDHDGR
jgi:dTDP-4-dehydrorhamnose 3,5-epimerase